jgi:hypothetical protein
MSIDKIQGINSYNIHPDSMKKDSDHNKHQSGDRKVNTDRTVQKGKQAESQKPAHQNEAVFNPETIRKAAQEMKAKIEDYMSDIKTQTPTTNKFYPPYPPEGEDRVQLLKQFPFFREQIAQLSMVSDSAAYDKIRENAKIPELQAEIKSMEIRNSLKSVKDTGITVSQSKLSELY